MRRFSLALIVFAACAALSCSKDKKTEPLTTGTIQGVARAAVGDTILAGVTVATTPGTSSVTTNGQGLYSIRDIPAREYAVTGTKSGYAPYNVSVSVVAGQTTTADITMARPAATSGIIRGLVRTAVGDTLLAGARVVTSPPTSSTTTEAQGRYEIPNAPPGPIAVTATKGGYDPATIMVSVVAGEVATADILMSRTDPALPPVGTIQGQVRTSVGDTLIVGARIVTSPPTASVTTDQQGYYTILHVSPGQYSVTATKTGYSPGHTAIVVTVRQTTTADIRLTSIPNSVARALLFDGVDDWVTIPDNSAIDLPGDFTIEAWVQLPNAQPNSGNTSPIVGKGPNQADRQQCYYLGVEHPNNNLILIIGNGYEAQTLRGRRNLGTGVWTHVAAVRSADSLALFLDGLHESSAPRTLLQSANDADLHIGGGPSQNAPLRLQGRIDNVRVWRVARTHEEIRTSFDCSLSPSSPGLVAYWYFDEDAQEPAVMDATPFANHGVLGSTADPEPSDPVRTVSDASLEDCSSSRLSTYHPTESN